MAIVFPQIDKHRTISIITKNLQSLNYTKFLDEL